MRTHFLAILGLCAFAVAQPILNALGQGATFFVTHGADATDVMVFALVIFLLPPLLLVAIAGCVGLISAAAGKVFTSGILAILCSFCSMLFLARFPAIVSLPLALAFGCLVGFGYFHKPRFRELLQWVGALSPIVIVSFVFFTPVSSFIFPKNIFQPNAEAQNATPIVMLIFDELSLAAITTPDGQLDGARLPNFLRLAELSTWYFDTTTVSTTTEKAVPAILTGRRPADKVPPIYSEFPNNLFSLFSATHAINAVEDITRLCPQTVCAQNAAVEQNELDLAAMYRDSWIVWQHAVFPNDLAQRYLPSISTAWGDFSQDDISEDSKKLGNFLRALENFKAVDNSQYFTEFVAQLGANLEHSVNYFHLGLPHTPWTYLPDGSSYNGKTLPGVTFTHWLDEKHLVDQAIMRYSLQVEYADLLLGEALDALEQSGQLNDVMLVVVSDHGTAFKPGGARRDPAPSTLADVARVPLFIKYPGQVGGVRDNRKVETIDIFPTIADVAQLTLDDSVDGQSLIGQNWQPAARQTLEVGNDIPDFEAAMDQPAASTRIYEVIAPGVSALNATGFGLAKKYTGRPVPDAATFDDQRKFTITSHYCFADLDTELPFRPIHLTGSLEGGGRGEEVMVGLNGTIAGSGMVSGEASSVSIVLDPRNFISGKNTLRVFTLTDRNVSEITVICGEQEQSHDN